MRQSGVYDPIVLLLYGISTWRDDAQTSREMVGVEGLVTRDRAWARDESGAIAVAWSLAYRLLVDACADDKIPIVYVYLMRLFRVVVL